MKKSTKMSPSPSSSTAPCNCLSSTLQLLTQTQTHTQPDQLHQPSHNPSVTPIPSISTSPSLSPPPTNPPHNTPTNDTTLHQGRSLSRLWNTLTHCPHSTVHLSDPFTLRSLTNTLANITTLYENCISSMMMLPTSPPNLHLQPYPGLFQQQPSSYPAPRQPRPSHEFNPTPSATYIGNLELEPDEAAIIVQEAMRESVVRLTGLVRDLQRAVEGVRLAQMPVPTWEQRVGGGVSGGGGYIGLQAPVLMMGYGQLEYINPAGLDYSGRGGSITMVGGGGETTLLPQEREMGELNVRLYGLLGRIDFISQSETIR